MDGCPGKAARGSSFRFKIIFIAREGLTASLSTLYVQAQACQRYRNQSAVESVEDAPLDLASGIGHHIDKGDHPSREPSEECRQGSWDVCLCGR